MSPRVKEAAHWMSPSELIGLGGQGSYPGRSQPCESWRRAANSYWPHPLGAGKLSLVIVAKPAPLAVQDASQSNGCAQALDSGRRYSRRRRSVATIAFEKRFPTAPFLNFFILLCGVQATARETFGTIPSVHPKSEGRAWVKCLAKGHIPSAERPS